MPGICMETCGGVAARDGSCVEMNFYWCAGEDSMIGKQCFLQTCMLQVTQVFVIAYIHVESTLLQAVVNRRKKSYVHDNFVFC